MLYIFLAQIANIQEHINSLDVVTEHSKWLVNYVLKQIKDDITSVVSDSQKLKEENEKLTKDSQTTKSEMETVKLTLADAMETMAEMEQHRSLLIASESQMKIIADAKDLLLALKDAELKHTRASAVQQGKHKP